MVECLLGSGDRLWQKQQQQQQKKPPILNILKKIYLWTIHVKHARFCINWRGTAEEERKSFETRWVVLYTSYAGSVYKLFIACLVSSSNTFQITHASIMRLAVLRVPTSYTTSPVVLKELPHPTLPHQSSYKSSHILHYLTSRPTRAPTSYTTSPVILHYLTSRPERVTRALMTTGALSASYFPSSSW